MDKPTLVAQIVELSRGAGKCEVTQLQARFILSTFGDLALSAMRGGDYVTLTGIGKLVPTLAKARKGRNPRTGAITTIPARTVIRLQLSRPLRKGL